MTRSAPAPGSFDGQARRTNRWDARALRVFEARYEASLPGGLHSATVVVPADELYGPVRRDPVKNGHAGQSRSCPSAPTTAGDLDAFARRPAQRLLENAPGLPGVLGKPEVGPAQPPGVPLGRRGPLPEQMDREGRSRSWREGVTQAPAAHQDARGEPYDPGLCRTPALRHTAMLPTAGRTRRRTACPTFGTGPQPVGSPSRATMRPPCTTMSRCGMSTTTCGRHSPRTRTKSAGEPGSRSAWARPMTSAPPCAATR